MDTIIGAGIQCVGLSIDGCKDSHDFIRRNGSYFKAINALKLMDERKFPTTCITSVNKINIMDLPILKNILIECGVRWWQIQLAMPMGNLLLNKDLVLAPQDISTVIDFCYLTAQEQKISICVGDNLGYHSDKYNKIFRCFNDYSGTKYIEGSCDWRGCSAGKNILGIRADGKIYGCLAIRDEKFCAGSVCETTLSNIWNDAKKFAWNRTLKKKDLSGFCQKCMHGDTCLGGCSAQKLSFGGSIHADNHNCTYRLEIEAITKDAEQMTEVKCLIDRAKEYIIIKNYQVAEIYVAKALDLSTNNVYLLNLAGFINFF